MSEPADMRFSHDCWLNAAPPLLQGFADCFGTAYLDFAAHAAFPLGVSADLVHLLWENFSTDAEGRDLGIPWIAISDLLLSDICREVGQERGEGHLYEMPQAVREALLIRLRSDPRFGASRMQEIGELLLHFSERFGQVGSDWLRGQRWVALAQLRPAQATSELAQRLAGLQPESVGPGAALRAELHYLDGILESLASPLAPDQANLGVYIKGLQRWTEGNAEAAASILLPMARSGAVSIAGSQLPIPQQLLRDTTKTPARVEVLERELPGSPGQGSRLIYRSSVMLAIDNLISKVAPSDLSVLITGETGTGKDLVARILHQRSRRAKAPFIVLNMAALMAGPAEAELVGVARMAGSNVTGHQGVLHAANKGTLFLDEVAEMPINLQAILLRTMIEREFCRIGSIRKEQSDVRFVFATYRNLEEMAENGHFRSDLYYRMNAIRIVMPPLRTHKEDIVDLARYFANKHNRPLIIAPETVSCLLNYDWPGNVRELCKFIDRCAALVKSDTIRPSDFYEVIGSRGSTANGPLAVLPSIAAEMDYQRVFRASLVDDSIKLLKNLRVAVLLETSQGGGKTLARQVSSRYEGRRTVWLNGHIGESSSPEQFYQQLTGDNLVLSSADYYNWLLDLATDNPLLIILPEISGPEELLDQMAGTFRNILEARENTALLVVGGERFLRLRHHQYYSWLRLFPLSSVLDVPDLTEDEIKELLRLREFPEGRAASLFAATGGHPALLHRIISKSIPEDALDTVEKDLALSHNLDRHLNDPRAREVLHRLLKGEAVAPLTDPAVRHEPERYAESRLYFDGFLHCDKDGKTQFRSLAARRLVEQALSPSHKSSTLDVT